MRMLSQTHGKQCKFLSFWNKLQCHLAHQAHLSTFHYSQKRKAGFLVERTVGGRRTLNRDERPGAQEVGGGI
jgi:hypothetical protein